MGRWRHRLLWAGLLLAAAPAGLDGDPSAYAVRLPLTLVRGASVQRVELPARALIALRSAAIADLRVFDGRGRAVPIARARPAGGAARREVLQALPILGSPDALKVTGVSLRLDRDGRARVANVDGTVAELAGATTVLGMILDASAIEGTARSLLVDADLPAGQPVTFVVEASEDLSAWRSLGERVIYRPPGSQGGSVGEAIPLQGRLPRGARLRVTWRAEFRLLSPVTVRSAVLTTRPEGATVVTADATPPPLLDARTVEFAVPFAAPIASITVIPAADDAVVPVRVLGRDDREEPWTLLGEGMAGPNAAAIALDGRSMRAMRIEADRRVTGFSAAPMVRFGLAPAAIAFVASGPPPFTLAAGRDETPNTFLPLASIVGRESTLLPFASVTVSSAKDLRLSPVSEGGASRRTILLWGVLLGATALLGGMAWLLWKRNTEPT